MPASYPSQPAKGTWSSKVASAKDQKFIFDIIASRMKKSVISFELLYRGTDCNEWTHKGVHSNSAKNNTSLKPLHLKLIRLFISLFINS